MRRGLERNALREMARKLLAALTAVLAMFAIATAPTFAHVRIYERGSNHLGVNPLRDHRGANNENPQVDSLEWVNEGEVAFTLEPRAPTGFVLCDEVELGTTVLVNSGEEETKLVLPWGVAEGFSSELRREPERSRGCRTAATEPVHTYFDILRNGAVGTELRVASITFPEPEAAREAAEERWTVEVHNFSISQRLAGSFCTVHLSGVRGTTENVTEGFVEESPPNLNITFTEQKLAVTPAGKGQRCPQEEELNARFFLETPSTETDTAFLA